jgi:Zn-finger nucleic acid-binding protein
VNCPACSAAFEKQTIAGQGIAACASCRGMWIARASVVALRDVDPNEHPWLGDPVGEAVPAALTTGRRKCPGCGVAMHGYAFGGGNTKVEACDRCEHVFLDRGELASIVREGREGIAMSDDAQQQLHLHRVGATWQRMSNAELGLTVIGVVALLVFVRVSLELELSPFGIALAVVIAVGLWWWLRRALLRDRKHASERLGRLMDGEHHRQHDASRPRPPPAPTPLPRSQAAKKCPFCSAPLGDDTTHCHACDSDFG